MLNWSKVAAGFAADDAGDAAAASTATTASLPGLAGFGLEDGTPVKLRLTRNLSSATDKKGDRVDFEVLEDVTAGCPAFLSLKTQWVPRSFAEQRAGFDGASLMILDSPGAPRFLSRLRQTGDRWQLAISR